MPAPRPVRGTPISPETRRLPRLTVKLSLALFALVAVSMLAVGGVAVRVLRDTVTARTTAHRVKLANWLAGELERAASSGPNRSGADFSLDTPEVTALLDRLSRQVYLELTLRDADGHLVHSQGDAPLELTTAMLEECARQHFSVTSGLLGRYPSRVTVPIQRTGRPLGYLQIGYHPALFDVPLTPLAPPLFLVGLALAALALVIAITLTRPLRRLAGSMRHIAAGDLEHRIPVASSDEFGELAATFNEMTAQLSAMIQGQREFLGGISHELRSPLARISLALEIARDRLERGLEIPIASLDQIAREVSDLDRLIGQLLTASRLELTAEPLRTAPVTVWELVEEVVRRQAADAQARGIQVLTGHPSEDQDLRIDADQNLLVCALGNLLDNAVKYSPDGTTVQVRWTRQGENVRIDVVDQGMGIDAPDLARLGEPFFRTDRSRSRQTGGIGLGIMLVKRIVERHRGRLEISSRQGEGSRFSLELPALHTF